MADEHQGVVWPDDAILEGERSGRHGFRRAHIATHAIQGDTMTFLRGDVAHEVGLSPGRSLSSGIQHLTAAVLARGGVDAVGATQSARFGVFNEFRGAELVRGTTESAAAFGLFTFRIGHGSTLG
jgi:hypothetical protein